MCISGEQVSTFVGFGMLVAVCSLAVPGLLNYYELVDSDAGRHVFMLHVLDDAENFNLTVTLSPADEKDNKACGDFIAETTGNDLELWLKKKVDLNEQVEQYPICNGELMLNVYCLSDSCGAHD